MDKSIITGVTSAIAAGMSTITVMRAVIEKRKQNSMRLVETRLTAAYVAKRLKKAANVAEAALKDVQSALRKTIVYNAGAPTDEPDRHFDARQRLVTDALKTLQATTLCSKEEIQTLSILPHCWTKKIMQAQDRLEESITTLNETSIQTHPLQHMRYLESASNVLPELFLLLTETHEVCRAHADGRK